MKRAVWLGVTARYFFEFFAGYFQNRFVLFEWERFDFVDESRGAHGKGIVPRSGQCPIVGASGRQHDLHRPGDHAAGSQLYREHVLVSAGHGGRFRPDADHRRLRQPSAGDQHPGFEVKRRMGETKEKGKEDLPRPGAAD